MEENTVNIGVEEIKKLIPHRYPFLMVDRVIDFVDNERIVTLKSVSCNEGYFEGHFPERPVMPGVLVLEAMAQSAAILSRLSSNGAPEGCYLYLVGADSVKWKKMVVPGDVLRIEMNYKQRRGPLWILEGRVLVDGKVVALGKVSAMESPQ